MEKNKRGQLATFQNAILGFVVLAVVLVVGLNILDQLQSQTSTTSSGTCNASGHYCSAAYNASGVTINAVDDFPTWFSIIVLVIVGAVIFGLLRAFGSQQ